MSTQQNNQPPLISWNNQLLEPVIITYNRAALLQKTLLAFLKSGLTSMRMHVLDNASTDDTAAVVQQIQQHWPQLQYHRNVFNIGGNGNTLRAVELSSSTYHWVIGDDDQWLLRPETIAELQNVLTQADADIIRLGWLVSLASRKKILSARELAQRENLFFASVSMISATIIRRALVGKYLAAAYQNTADSYPQLIPLIRATEENAPRVYTLSQDLMLHTPSKEPGYFCGDLEWYAGWFRTSRFFNDTVLKKRFVNEVTYYMCQQFQKKPTKLNQFIWLTKVLLYFKSFGLNQWPYLLSMLAYGTGARLLVFLLLVINGLTPMSLLAFLRKCYFKLNRLPQKTIRVDRSRL